MSEIDRLNKQIAKLQKQAAMLQAKKRKPILTGILRQMREFEISSDEIAAAFGQAGVGRKSQRKTGSGKAAKHPVAPKYRHPDTGETWSGRGRAPRWLTEAESAGANRVDFLLEKHDADTNSIPDYGAWNLSKDLKNLDEKNIPSSNTFHLPR